MQFNKFFVIIFLLFCVDPWSCFSEIVFSFYFFMTILMFCTFNLINLGMFQTIYNTLLLIIIVMLWKF